MKTAHCLVGFPPVAAVAVNFTGFSEGRYSHEREVIAVVIHQMYNGKFLYNDIALLILDSPITTEITPIQLDKNNGVPTDNQILKAVGFGATDNGGTIYPDDLMEVELAQKTCENTELYSLDISTLVCAGEGGKSICFGDSGNEPHTSTIVTTILCKDPHS
jgi:secreted trypsin-like serine protease